MSAPVRTTEGGLDLRFVATQLLLNGAPYVGAYSVAVTPAGQVPADSDWKAPDSNAGTLGVYVQAKPPGWYTVWGKPGATPATAGPYVQLGTVWSVV